MELSALYADNGCFAGLDLKLRTCNKRQLSVLTNQVIERLQTAVQRRPMVLRRGLPKLPFDARASEAIWHATLSLALH